MAKRTLLVGLGVVVALALVATPVLLAPGPVATPAQPAAAIDAAEQAQLIEALKPPKRARPVIALLTRNEGTEVTDFLVSYGVLSRADVADVEVVAEKAEPVHLYPNLSVDPETTMSDFDVRYPDGADYVIVPAMDPGTDPVIAAWLVAQHGKGAKIVSICNGGRMVATAGLLDGRRATSHWSVVPELRSKHPSMEWVPDRRYVSDDNVISTTGISASVPAMLALVEAIGGRDTAQRVADDLGVDNWDARHNSAAFELTTEHKKTFIRNNVTFWRHESVGIPIAEGVDEISLSMLVDAYSRTELADVVTLSQGGAAVRSRYGLTIRPERPLEGTSVDLMLDPPATELPATTLDRELPLIEARYDRPTAAIAALVMEYPWTPQ